MLSHERGIKKVLIPNRRQELKEKGGVKMSLWFKEVRLGDKLKSHQGGRHRQSGYIHDNAKKGVREGLGWNLGGLSSLETGKRTQQRHKEQ